LGDFTRLQTSSRVQILSTPNGRKTDFGCISRLLIFELNQTMAHFGTFGVLVNPNYQFASIALQGKYGSVGRFKYL